jgi:hypothetical protein
MGTPPSATSATTVVPVTAERANAATRNHHRVVLAGIAFVTALVLVLTVGSQISDSNLVVLTEATALLAGDHPYRDFFEWGAPLAAYLSAGAPLLVGSRLIGEFLIQWLFIVAGVVISFHLGLRLSRSIRVSLLVLPLVLIILAGTPTYHYSKLFVFPLTIWLGWWYMDHPGVRRSAGFGFASAVAFLLRHDYGVYAVLAFLTALVLACRPSESRRFRSMVNDAAAWIVAAAVLVGPWAMVVQTNEGLVDYVKTRAAMYEAPESAFVYASLLALNPVRAMSPTPTPTPTPGIVGFFWKDGVDDALRHQVERRHGLRLLDERDDLGRWRYQVSNVYDPSLLELDRHINDGIGFPWDRLNEMRWHLPRQEHVLQWLQQMTLLIPLLLLLTGGVTLYRRHRFNGDAPDARRMVLAGLFLAVVDSALLRQASYMVVVAPVTAALSASFLLGKTVLGRACAVGTLMLTGFAAIVSARDTLVFRPSYLVSSMPATWSKLLASPPVSDYAVFRYLRECTISSDRLLVTGETPFHVSYYAQRPIAGGHLYWHTGWRSGAFHEAQSLALLQRQSVPFVVSTRTHALDDFTRYPAIHAHLVKNYVELEGSDGAILVDARRRPTGRFGPMGFPCFR